MLEQGPGLVIYLYLFGIYIYFDIRSVRQTANKSLTNSKPPAGRWPRINGSHDIMEKDGMPRSIPVPVHGAKDIGAGLLAELQRQTGVKLK